MNKPSFQATPDGFIVLKEETSNYLHQKFLCQFEVDELLAALQRWDTEDDADFKIETTH